MQLKTPTDQHKSAAIIAESLITANTNGPVLWLLSGGSAIELEVLIVTLLPKDNTIHVTLMDERYGPVGHSNSNWQQLTEAGFDWSRITATPVLVDTSTEETTNSYLSNLMDLTTRATTIIGLFGMGADGHTAGILPDSLATTTENMVSCYEGPDYQRITITPSYIHHIHQAFLYACGDNKRAQLEQFIHQDTNAALQPVQYLKYIKQLTILTDQEGL